MFHTGLGRTRTGYLAPCIGFILNLLLFPGNLFIWLFVLLSSWLYVVNLKIIRDSCKVAQTLPTWSWVNESKWHFSQLSQQECHLPLPRLAVSLSHKPKHFQSRASFSNISRATAVMARAVAWWYQADEKPPVIILLYRHTRSQPWTCVTVSVSPTRNMSEFCAGACLGNSHTSEVCGPPS